MKYTIQVVKRYHVATTHEVEAENVSQAVEIAEQEARNQVNAHEDFYLDEVAAYNDDFSEPDTDATQNRLDTH